jgi:hypothetical protein
LRHGIKINLTSYFLFDYRKFALCSVQRGAFFDCVVVAYRASAYHEHKYTGEPDLGEPVCL